MDIIYLDQNQWIELAKVRSGKATESWLTSLSEELENAVKNGKVLFPLSGTHILETSKRNDPASRRHVAEIQAVLSLGCAYRSYTSRLQVEIKGIIHRLLDLHPFEMPKNWFLGRSFLQAFEPADALVAEPLDALRFMRIESAFDPKYLYLDYMQNQDDATRRIAHQKLEEGLRQLIERNEKRRALCQGESIDLRRRVYRARQFLDVQDTVIKLMTQLGISYEKFRALGDVAVKSIVELSPTLDVEAEFSARIDARAKSLNTHDALDLQAIYTAIPYSSHVIAEKSAISIAQQAKLDKKYKVKLSRSLQDLVGVYA
ncbi:MULTISPECIES: hypothetical protein [Comamonas]|uniref:hypothetical protein n=1 Tax=Comamonas TaxID=283 RepID=UPI00050DF30F|nr:MULTISPECIES: hypothetical protein [Comamonas]KGH05726.1 hypothetical protein P365_10635 [Comamonas thiooxydans]KGH13593.1 hypothetical protein P368_10290 [Comamonas thiooxydans]TZG11693.1 hypothetical protein FZC30_07580 [Comamonas thiooxydans]UNV91272.1 hypothetical protein MP576_02670 [Comamonas sp. 7D-2evo1]UNV95426.1 hypothetical protein MPZ60_23670 [Comamonas sp. 7D-2]